MLPFPRPLGVDYSLLHMSFCPQKGSTDCDNVFLSFPYAAMSAFCLPTQSVTSGACLRGKQAALPPPSTVAAPASTPALLRAAGVRDIYIAPHSLADPHRCCISVSLLLISAMLFRFSQTLGARQDKQPAAPPLLLQPLMQSCISWVSWPAGPGTSFHVHGQRPSRGIDAPRTLRQ
ncbi:hypothetical protein DL89DRAFT_95534 [Linderina pennispora]|uniref:Uncharacterized protein n=1 Tax=Linderina pennispora TaxID=61395 RepID=A0A1Y1VXM7_9FUNG|nr:uncharacterized protein DL89DRAFT_95534 [Linderina pennispora]ORX65785.1 hypothetical protein DL89DRAFT_95534 [Linderina pennispora]